MIYHPGVLSAFRLARSRFHQECWPEVIEAYELGVKNKVHPQLLDSGEIYEDATRIFVAVALRKLGRYAEAAELSKEIHEKFPRSAALAELDAKLQVAKQRAEGRE